MRVADYFSGIEKSLRRIKGAELSGQITSLASDDYNGLLRCRVLFWDGSFLDVYEVVNTELGYPVKVHYSYTYLADGQRIFRYDNAPHHPEISTHPHHKHHGGRDKLIAAEEPTLSQILDEIHKILKEK
ncbi:MAG TPA: DUF6516 family protein [Anaerolineales bacterium]|nr:DUF6516 family protein [Anaerolineales bacterium]